MKKIATAVAVLAFASSALASEGADLYKSKCASCHGPDGKGDVPIGKTLKVKSLVGTKLSAADIDKIVAEGKPGTKMVAVKSLSPEQRKAVAAFVKSLP
jgi:mono/diheme cytochrome c family protein